MNDFKLVFVREKMVVLGFTRGERIGQTMNNFGLDD